MPAWNRADAGAEGLRISSRPRWAVTIDGERSGGFSRDGNWHCPALSTWVDS